MVDIGCVLSVGTGQCPSSEVGSSKFAFGTPGSINEGISMIRDLMNLKNILIEQITSSGGECVKRARSWAHDQKIAFFRLSPPLSKAVELDESDNEVIVDFLWDTEVCSLPLLCANQCSSLISMVIFICKYDRKKNFLFQRTYNKLVKDINFLLSNNSYSS
ncbi:unnamed protein product [Anisakis simplex]|uniref:Uncharacterized protein n=1 Tax=Anisakis simplex TaxID=6269 RepID=A0A3P6SQ60_ANISI|nr:unnamed protein product [Anisakis simplex]